MSQNLNISLTVDAWADIVIKNWQRRITDLKIGSSGELYDSFVQHVLNSTNGVPERIEFAHIYYGIFTDMGVGNGVRYGTNNEVNTRRKPKPWRSKQLFQQKARLAELLAEKYGMVASAVIIEHIEESERLNASANGSSISKPSSSTSELDLAWMRHHGLL